MSEPARRYSWPPFAPGHTLSMRHGARSPRMVEPIAARLRAELAEAAAWTSAPAFAPAVEAWAYAEAQCRLLRAYINEHGILDDSGEPRSALGQLGKAEARAERARQQLGLTPAAWAQLYRAMIVGPAGDVGGIEALRATGRQMIEANETAAAELERGDDSG